MPDLDDFFVRLGVGSLPGLDRDALEADMAEVAEAQQLIVERMGALLFELDLDPTAKT